MHLPQIRIESTFAKLGLNIEKPVQSIEQPKTELSIQQPKAILQIETTKGKLSIDQTKAWNDMDLKSVFKRIEEFAHLGYQDHLEGMARRAEQGDELMKIEHQGNPIQSQAKQNSERPYKQLHIGWIPSHFSVDIHYEPAKVNIDVQPQKPIIDAQIRKPIHDYTPGKVSGYMERWNSLSIDYINLFDEKM